MEHARNDSMKLLALSTDIGAAPWGRSKVPPISAWLSAHLHAQAHRLLESIVLLVDNGHADETMPLQRSLFEVMAAHRFVVLPTPLKILKVLSPLNSEQRAHLYWVHLAEAGLALLRQKDVREFSREESKIGQRNRHLAELPPDWQAAFIGKDSRKKFERYYSGRNLADLCTLLDLRSLYDHSYKAYSLSSHGADAGSRSKDVPEEWDGVTSPFETEPHFAMAKAYLYISNAFFAKLLGDICEAFDLPFKARLQKCADAMVNRTNAEAARDEKLRRIATSP